jgi:hypothetical protein
MPYLTPVLEKSLLDFESLKVITDPKICLTDRGYIYVFSLRKVDGLHSLYVTRGGWPRTWKSLDRMTVWLREKKLLSAAISLQIAATIEIEDNKPRGNPNETPP